MKKLIILSMLGISSLAFAQLPDPVWTYSPNLNAHYYRDNDGRVHYSDGSVGPVNDVWHDESGRAVYSANSAGPADKTGQYAIQAPRISDNPPGPPPPTPAGNGGQCNSNGGAVFGGCNSSGAGPIRGGAAGSGNPLSSFNH